MYYTFYKLSTYPFIFFFFFNDTATTEIYTLSLHDALPISIVFHNRKMHRTGGINMNLNNIISERLRDRSEEHTSELQSHLNLVCRLLLEKKKKNRTKQK